MLLAGRSNKKGLNPLHDEAGLIIALYMFIW